MSRKADNLQPRSYPRPLRILMTADTVGGVFTYALQLIEALGPHDVEVLLATMGRPLSESQHRTLDRLPNVQVARSSFKLEWMAEPWADVDAAGRWLLEVRDRFGPDVVHLNGFCHGDLPWGVPIVMVAHSDVLSWHEACRKSPAGPEWETYRRRVARGLGGADLVAAPTRAMLDDLSRNFPLASETVVVPNARAMKAQRVEKKAFVLCVGRLWDEAKNLRTLAAAATGLDWPVRVAGDATSPDGGQLAPPPGVELLGQCSADEIAALMRDAAIYALPARYEPFGLSALEAALSGCALVLGDIPSLREVWGDAALFVQPDDADGLRRVLNGLIDDRARRTRLAAAAGRRAERYSPERQACSYLAVYRRLLETHSCPLLNAS